MKSLKGQVANDLKRLQNDIRNKEEQFNTANKACESLHQSRDSIREALQAREAELALLKSGKEDRERDLKASFERKEREWASEKRQLRDAQTSQANELTRLHEEGGRLRQSILRYKQEVSWLDYEFGFGGSTLSCLRYSRRRYRSQTRRQEAHLLTNQHH